MLPIVIIITDRNQNPKPVQQKSERLNQQAQKLGGVLALITSQISSNGLRNRWGIRLRK